MKKLITIGLLGLFFTASAQKFEGAINWTASYTLKNESVRDKALQYLPTSHTFIRKDGNYIINVQGTPRPVQMLWRKDQGRGFKLDMGQKTWSSIDPVPAAEPGDKKATIINTDEQREISGYACTKYVIRQAGPKIALQQEYWVTQALDGLGMQKDLANASMGTTTTLFHKDIDGMPLRIEINTPIINILVEATSVKKEPVPASLFAIPADFKQAK